MAGGVTEVLAPVPISPGQARPVIRISSHSYCGALAWLETVWLGSRSLLPPGQEAYVYILVFRAGWRVIGICTVLRPLRLCRVAGAPAQVHMQSSSGGLPSRLVFL